mmetsp:Transcript_6062/g.7826  ORF Transcript_6062/g.7826 Transcript_6062/m.7826 type:complete len:218 (-) Transcript_6062:178-831(-)|eukprot:CAMPEP_0198138768 /NCGR_PEP_ID=MMETSP1443-20131203/2159_1 /TAXON_ID=186043 /ORGANISM="Entomoneis sp., Strain CCMP2396" /LENGTH=217 /DNA_ID=CAMNT_0043800695 /DNA_START=72 /DNA_END=725 /DNA_ORIENTATION=-
MKLFFLLPSAAFAFVGPAQLQRSTSLFVQADASEAIQAALEATKKYGATSAEARVLWDNVEEMRFDNSPATMGGMDQECELDDEGSITAACSEYDTKMAELSALMNEYETKLTKMKTLTQDLSSIKGKVNSASKPTGNDSPETQTAMTKAISEAKKASEEFGPTSSEAKLAWETVEDIASSGLGNAMGSTLDEECLVEQASDACKAMEELKGALEIN